MYNIPRYQTGSYIPGLSSQIFGAGLGRDVASTQEDLRKKARSLGKKQGWGKFGSFLGKSGGKWLGKALSAGFAATNPLYALAIQAGGAGLGSYLGSKLGRGKDVSLANKHGLLGSQYKDIGKYQRGMESAAKGAAWGDAAQTFGQGLKSEAGKNIWAGMDADKKTKWFGENLGSKSHEELSKMRLGNMIGKGRLAQGAEDWLGKFGQKEFETDRLKDTAKWAYGGAKDIYGAGKDIYQSGQEFFENAPELYELYKNRNQGNIFNRNQLGGMIGMQEGGSPRSISGAQPVEWNYDDPEMLRALFSVPAGQVGEGEGLRYYSAEKPYTQLANLDRKVLFNRAVQGMASAPQDSIPSNMVENYFDEPKSNFLQKLFGKQEGGIAENNYPLQMSGGQYSPEQGYGGLIQHRKGY